MLAVTQVAERFFNDFLLDTSFWSQFSLPEVAVLKRPQSLRENRVSGQQN